MHYLGWTKKSRNAKSFFSYLKSFLKVSTKNNKSDMLQFHELFIRKLLFVKKKKNLQHLISFQGWTRPTKIPEMRTYFTAAVCYLLI